jgi:acetolactate decarboxylase
MNRILVALIILITSSSFGQDLSLKVMDTDFSKGRLTNEQTISVEDVSKLHGHMCDGLVLGFIGLREALYQLFPDSVIDRTNIRIISKSSPCITDIAIYLTGGRYQFNTFYVNDTIQYLYIVQRIDTGKAIGIKTVPNLVPPQIKELGALAVKGELDACGLDTLRNLEDAFILQLKNSNPSELFILTEIPSFSWESPLDKTYLKTDVLNKNKPKCN